MPSHTPLPTPYLTIASWVYSEHVGRNRHDGGSTLEIVIWYILIKCNATPFTKRPTHRPSWPPTAHLWQGGWLSNAPEPHKYSCLLTTYLSGLRPTPGQVPCFSSPRACAVSPCSWSRPCPRGVPQTTRIESIAARCEPISSPPDPQSTLGLAGGRYHTAEAWSGIGRSSIDGHRDPLRRNGQIGLDYG